jgi:hypothetical protein
MFAGEQSESRLRELGRRYDMQRPSRMSTVGSPRRELLVAEDESLLGGQGLASRWLVDDDKDRPPPEGDSHDGRRALAKERTEALRVARARERMVAKSELQEATPDKQRRLPVSRSLPTLGKESPSDASEYPSARSSAFRRTLVESKRTYASPLSALPLGRSELGASLARPVNLVF